MVKHNKLKKQLKNLDELLAIVIKILEKSIIIVVMLKILLK